MKVQLPLFLHSRAAHADFVRLLKKVLGEKLEKIQNGGLVHSFTGTVEEMQELVELGLHVGINGCSMKTQENVEVVKGIPLERLQIETDGPWVSISDFSYQSLVLHDFPRDVTFSFAGVVKWVSNTDLSSAKCALPTPRLSIQLMLHQYRKPLRRRNGNGG